MLSSRKIALLFIVAFISSCNGGVEVTGNGSDANSSDEFIAEFGQPERITTAAPVLAKALGFNAAAPIGSFLNDAFPENSPGTPSSSSLTGWVQQNYYPNLTFVEPIRIVEHPVENKLIVLGKDGMGWSVTHEPGATDKTLFLDVSSIMHGKSGVGEGGVSDLVFHPEFGQV